MPQRAKERDGLQPAEGLFHELALPMTEAVSRMSCRPGIDRAATVAELVRHDMRRDAHLAHGGHSSARVVRLVGGHRDPPRSERQLAEHDDRGVAFGRPTRGGDRRVDDEAVAILGQQVAEIPRLGLAPARFLVQPGIRIGGRLVRVIPPRLPVKITVGFFGSSGRAAPILIAGIDRVSPK